MILDADKYRINKKFIEQLLRDKTSKERLDSIGALAVSTGVPIIIVCVYVGELFGFTDDLLNQLERHKTFYSVTEVLNVKK